MGAFQSKKNVTEKEIHVEGPTAFQNGLGGWCCIRVKTGKKTPNGGKGEKATKYFLTQRFANKSFWEIKIGGESQ